MTLLALVLLLAGVVALFRLYRSDDDHAGLLVAVAVMVGLLLLTTPVFGGLLESFGRPLVALIRGVAWAFGPLLVLIWALVRAVRWARRLWDGYRLHGGTGRSLVVAGTVGFGLFAAVLLRAEPWASGFTDIVTHEGSAALKTAWDSALDRIAEGLDDTADPVSFHPVHPIDPPVDPVPLGGGGP